MRPGTSTLCGDAYAVDVSVERPVLHGESRRAVYYAAAHLLHALGVRWHAPGEIGEVVPQRPTITIAVGRMESAPDFVTRRLWCAGPEQTRWMYRNRLGEPTVPCGHSVHALAAALPGWKGGIEGRSQHPEYYALVDGKPGRINLANPEVVHISAARAIDLLQAGPRRGAPGGKRGLGEISASTDDGCLADERPEVPALTNGEVEPILRLPSFSDAWFGFPTRVCAEIEAQAPGLDFKPGSLAYMNYLLPPDRVQPDWRTIPVIAPLSFNRYASMGTPGAQAAFCDRC